MPEISIILPFYNNKNELDTAISSIMAQTFSNFELMLVNNNADITACQIAAKWVKQDARIRLLNEPKQGIAFALNTGINSASGNWIARMDADDEAHPTRLEKQIAFAKANPGIDVVATQTTFRSKCAKNKGYSLFVDWQNSIILPEEHALARFRESPLAHPSVMFRKKLVELYGAYNTGYVPEDYELWLRWLDRGVRFYKLPEQLLSWNDHENRLSRTHENYSKEAFFTVKLQYLAKWLQRTIPPQKKIIVCGASKIGRRRAAMLVKHGIDIYGFTDVKDRQNKQIRFIPMAEIRQAEKVFLINFIGKRGVHELIDLHFSALGFHEGRDYIHGA